MVGLLGELIRIDTTNTGDESTTVGERAAAEYVAGKLAEVGYETTYVEGGQRGRGNVIARLAGSDPLAAAVTRLDQHRFPLVLTDSVREFLAAVSELTGIAIPLDDPEAAIATLGGVARLVGATLRDTTNVTMFSAGYKANVVPSVAEATVDCRILPGREAAFDGELVDSMTSAILTEDPGARVLPYMLAAVPTRSRSSDWESGTSASPR